MHIQHILSKLGVHNRAQAVAVPHGAELVELDDVEAHLAVEPSAVARVAQDSAQNSPCQASRLVTRAIDNAYFTSN
jgi:hypothetical protein